MLEVTKDRTPAKCLALRAVKMLVCYYLQQAGKPVGNPGASGKLGVVGKGPCSLLCFSTSIPPAPEGIWEPGAYFPKRNLGGKTNSGGWA